MASINFKRHLYLLSIIDKEKDNRFCADCGVEGTRWASWNLGVFLCIRCAGIHRKLGVHISKVKSVDLDSWTVEQLQSMETKGNRISKEMYETNLPKDFIRPQSNYAIEEFIRNKYDLKKFVDVSDEPSNSKAVESSKIVSPKISFQANEKSCLEPEGVDGDDDDSLSEPEYLTSNQKSKTKSISTHKVHSHGDLISLDNPVKFSSIQLHPSNAKTTDILSLYNKPASNSSSSYQGTNRGYGSASCDSYTKTTTSIAESNNNSYLRQIQDKLTSLRTNITSALTSYEQPSELSANYSVQSRNWENESSGRLCLNSTNGSQSTNNSTKSGQTLSPDLWQ